MGFGTFYIGSPFTNPTGTLPAQNAHDFKVRDHALNVLFSIPFTCGSWHNFGVQVDWDHRTLAVLYSQNAAPLQPVTKVIPNLTVSFGSIGQGDFHFGVLKVLVFNCCSLCRVIEILSDCLSASPYKSSWQPEEPGRCGTLRYTRRNNRGVTVFRYICGKYSKWY